MIYTGTETKLFLNQGSYRNKQSFIEKMLNLMLGVNVIALFIIIAVLATRVYVFTEN